MTAFGHLEKEAQQHIAQTLLAGKAAANSIISLVESLQPLSQDGLVHTKLLRIGDQATSIRGTLQNVYAEMAEDAFSEVLDEN